MQLAGAALALRRPRLLSPWSRAESTRSTMAAQGNFDRYSSDRLRPAAGHCRAEQTNARNNFPTPGRSNQPITRALPPAAAFLMFRRSLVHKVGSERARILSQTFFREDELATRWQLQRVLPRASSAKARQRLALAGPVFSVYLLCLPSVWNWTASLYTNYTIEAVSLHVRAFAGTLWRCLGCLSQGMSASGLSGNRRQP